MSLRKQDLIFFLFGLVLFGVLQGLISGRVIGSFWQLNLLFLGINIILTASLNLINGYTGQFSLGHAGFMAVGAYVLAIATLGLGEIIRVVLINIDYVGGAAGFKGIARDTNFAWVFFAVFFTLFFIKNFVNSTHGRACIAIREDEIAAEAMGIPTTRYKVMAFAIGAGFAGLGGGLFAHTLTYLNPTSFTFMQSFFFLIMVVLGGMGSLTGSIVGAFFVTILQAALASWPEFRMIIFAVALILFMLYRPRGIFGYVELTAFAPLKRIFGKGGQANG